MATDLETSAGAVDTPPVPAATPAHFSGMDALIDSVRLLVQSTEDAPPPQIGNAEKSRAIIRRGYDVLPSIYGSKSFQTNCVCSSLP